MKFRSDDRAVSDVVGSILLVAITVAMMAGLSVVVLSIDGPSDEVYADLQFTAQPGAGGWGTGDEFVRLQHAGGEELPASKLQIIIGIGSSAFTYSEADFDQGFADGKLTIGEKWERVYTIQDTDIVKATAVYDKRSLLVLATVRSDPSAAYCAADVDGPTVQLWQQSPSDVTTLTVGAVDVTATLIDNCYGTDDASVPALEFRIDGGAWNATAGLTLTGAGKWSGSIPDQSWSTREGQLLEYRITGMKDLIGNTATSITRSDTIALVDPIQYVESFTEFAGSVADFPNAQSASDGGAYSSLTESSGVATLLATSATGTGSSIPANAAGIADDIYATLATSGDQVTVSGFDVSGLTGTITKVELVFEGHYSGIQVDDHIDLLVKANSGFVTVDSNHVPPLLIDGTHTVDITTVQGSWSWADVSVVEARALYSKVGGEDSLDFRVDNMFIQVTTAVSNDLQIELQFPTLVGGTTHTLQIDYAAPVDTYTVEVWDGTTWNQRGATMDQTSMTSWSYTLTAQESATAPKVRILDVSAGPPLGMLNIDFARVETT